MDKLILFILWPLLDIIINDMILRFVNLCTSSNTVVYWLIATATITLSKQKSTTNKQGRLHERWPLNLCRVLRSVVYMVATYVSDVIGDLYQIAITCS